MIYIHQKNKVKNFLGKKFLVTNYLPILYSSIYCFLIRYLSTSNTFILSLMLPSFVQCLGNFKNKFMTFYFIQTTLVLLLYFLFWRLENFNIFMFLILGLLFGILIQLGNKVDSLTKNIHIFTIGSIIQFCFGILWSFYNRLKNPLDINLELSIGIFI